MSLVPPIQPVDFGSSADLHAESMALLWGPFANLAIILAFYTYRKWWIWLHGAYFLVITIITLSTAIPILQATGVVQADSTLNYEEFSAQTLNSHYIIGITCLIAFSLVTIMGIITKLLNIFQGPSKFILLFRKLHTISGFLIVILCKANIYVIVQLEQWTPYIVIDAISVVIVVVWKLFFPRIEGKQIAPKVSAQVKLVPSIKLLDPYQDYVVFANYVYQVAPLKYSHPAGFQIINTVRNKEVDRYIYGSCSTEELQEIPIWSHTYKSFTLLGDPIAKINIPPTYLAFDGPEIECSIRDLRLISQKGSIYQLTLAKKVGLPFQFTGYRQITQLGRYFSVSLNDKVTRLYTTVNFLNSENMQFLLKQFINSRSSLLSQSQLQDQIVRFYQSIRNWSNQNNMQPSSSFYQQGTQRPLEIELMSPNTRVNFQTQQSVVPLMFKKYPGGKFTSNIVQGPVNKIVLSENKGEGLQLANTSPGRIVVVAGGTGLFPFSDLIDLLYKEQLINYKPQLKEEILHLSPILANNPFQFFAFQLLAAFNSLDDIHFATRQQLLFLAQVGRISLTLKIKEDPRSRLREGQNIRLIHSDFEPILREKLAQKVSKVWICGPPK